MLEYNLFYISHASFFKKKNQSLDLWVFVGPINSMINLDI
jgi:hypothetical protein